MEISYGIKDNMLDRLCYSLLEGQTFEDIVHHLKDELHSKFAKIINLSTKDLHREFELEYKMMNRLLKRHNISHVEGRGSHGEKYYQPEAVSALLIEHLDCFPINTVAGCIVRQQLGLSAAQLRRIIDTNYSTKIDVYGKKSISLKTCFEILSHLHYRTKIVSSYYQVEDLAEAKDVDITTVRTWIRQGDVKAESIKYKCYISPEEFCKICEHKSFSELSAILGIPEKALRGAYERKQIFSQRFSGQIVFSGEEIKRILDLIEEEKLFSRSKNKQKRSNVLQQALSMNFQNIDFLKYPEDSLENPIYKNKIILAAKAGHKIAQKKILSLLENKSKMISGYQCRIMNIPYSDCLHYSTLGILKAIQKFPDLSYDFIGYACVCMKYSIKDEALADYRTVYEK